MTSDAFHTALDALSVLKEINLTLLPQRASKEMAEAGATAGGVSEVEAMVIYEAMVKTAEAYPLHNLDDVAAV